MTKLKTTLFSLLTAMIMIGSFAKPVHAETIASVKETADMSFLNSDDNTQEMQDRPGMIGRFYIPDTDVNVALFSDTNATPQKKQAYVDAVDSSLWFVDKGKTVIVDHASDNGFRRTYDAAVGSTKGYVQVGNEIKTYICIAKGNGKNVTNGILDENSNYLADREGYSLMTYCCSDSTGIPVCYTLWIPYDNQASSQCIDFPSTNTTDDYLSFLRSEDNSQEMYDRPGMIGRFYIPDVAYDAALFDCETESNEVTQKRVDDKDSASWFTHKKMAVIGDHGDQGFENIKNVIPYKTVAYIQTGLEIKKFICTSNGIGTNTRKKILDENGNSITEKEGHSFLTYTCVDETGVAIYYALWSPLN